MPKRLPLAAKARNLHRYARTLRKTGYPRLGAFLVVLTMSFCRLRRQRDLSPQSLVYFLCRSEELINYLKARDIDLGPDNFDPRLYLQFEEEHFRGKSPVTHSRNLFRYFIRTFYSQYLSVENSANPWWQSLPLLVRNKGNRIFATRQQVNRLIRRFAASPRLLDRTAAIFAATIASCGFRSNEAFGLAPADLFQDNGYWFAVILSKRRRRLVPVPPKIKAMLDFIINFHGGNRYFAPICYKNSLGHYYNRPDFLDRWHEFSDGRFTPLSLRRYFATELHERGCPLEMIAVMMGHGSVKVTLDYIGDKNERALKVHKKIRNKLGLDSKS